MRPTCAVEATGGFILVITDPVRLLADSPEHLTTFVEICRDATRTWNRPPDTTIHYDHPRCPYHVVLLGGIETRELVRETWARAGWPVQRWP